MPISSSKNPRSYDQSTVQEALTYSFYCISAETISQAIYWWIHRGFHQRLQLYVKEKWHKSTAQIGGLTVLFFFLQHVISAATDPSVKTVETKELFDDVRKLCGMTGVVFTVWYISRLGIGGNEWKLCVMWSHVSPASFLPLDVSSAVDLEVTAASDQRKPQRCLE